MKKYCVSFLKISFRVLSFENIKFQAQTPLPHDDDLNILEEESDDYDGSSYDVLDLQDNEQKFDEDTFHLYVNRVAQVGENHFVVEAFLMKLYKETEKLKQAFKIYVESSHLNMNQAFNNSKIVVNLINATNNVFDNETRIYFELTTLNIDIKSSDLKLSENDSVFDLIFDFFDLFEFENELYDDFNEKDEEPETEIIETIEADVDSTEDSTEDTTAADESTDDTNSIKQGISTTEQATKPQSSTTEIQASTTEQATQSSISEIQAPTTEPAIKSSTAEIQASTTEQETEPTTTKVQTSTIVLKHLIPSCIDSFEDDCKSQHLSRQ